MTLLPIVARELRVAARRAGTYWVRSGAALVILVIGTWFFLMYSGLPPQDIARGLFYILTGAAVLFCLLSGVWFTSDSLSEEKREGTLGLLFLTDLRGYDVVVGKLFASLMNGAYSVLAVVPILALPLLLGGVTAGEFGRMALVIVDTLFFSLTLGMFVSALSRSPRKAMGATLALLAFFTALLPLVGCWRWMFGQAPQMKQEWLMASAGYLYYWALDQGFSAEPKQFWLSAGVVHGLSWVALVLASVLAPRTWQDRPAGRQTVRWRDQWHWWSFGNRTERTEFRGRLLDRAAYFWLAARARLGPAYVWAVLGLVACGWTWGLARARREWLNEANYVLTGLLLNLLIKVWFGLESGRAIAEDRKQGTLELLLSTPLTIRDILYGQWLALRRQFLGPVLVVCGAFIAFAMAVSSDSAMAEEAEDRLYWVAFWMAGIVMLAADLAALYWVGMWKALTAKNPTRAAAGNLSRILILPWIILALFGLVVSLVWPNAQSVTLPRVFLGAWVLVGLTADLGFGLWARHKLLTEFRLAATRRYVPRRGILKRLLTGSSSKR